MADPLLDKTTQAAQANSSAPPAGTSLGSTTGGVPLVATGNGNAQTYASSDAIRNRLITSLSADQQTKLSDYAASQKVGPEGLNNDQIKAWIDANQTTPTAPATPTNTLTSDAAKADSNDTVVELQKRQQDLVTQQQDALRKQLAAETAGINTQYDTRERQLGETQKEESLTSNALQFKLGRAGTEYASDATVKLNQIHQDQINELAQQRQDLIAKATAAYQTGNIALAKEALKADQDAYDKQQQLKQQMRENISRDLSDALNKQKLSSDTITAGQEKITTMAKSNIDPSTISATDKATLEQGAGLPAGSFDSFFKVQQQANNIKTAKDTADLAKTVMDLADKIPQGTSQSIKLPDGSTYEIKGTMEPKHSAAYIEWQDYKSTGGKLDFNAYQTFDANRKRAITNVSMGNDQKAKELTPKFLETIKKAVGPDGKISPDDWNSLRTGWVGEGGQGVTFDASFGQFINPAADKRSAYFTEKLPTSYTQ